MLDDSETENKPVCYTNVENSHDQSVPCKIVQAEVNNVKFEDDSVSECDESSKDTSETTENTHVLPVLKNVQPLPQGRWHKAEDIYKIIKQRSFVHNEVPPGDKSNSYMLVDNTRNYGWDKYISILYWK